MARLNQIVAVVNGKKTQAQRDITELHKRALKGELYDGHLRKYEPAEDESSQGFGAEKHPDEVKKVQLQAEKVLGEARGVWTQLFDVIFTQDVANTTAKADIIVDDDEVIAEGVPVTYLMFLEKQLVDICTFLEKLPELDPSDDWKMDAAKGVFATAPTSKLSTRKITDKIVKYEATVEHPAQVDLIQVDRVVGNWITAKFSGRMEATRKLVLLERVRKLQHAVKFAREQANMNEVENQEIGRAVFDFLLR